MKKTLHNFQAPPKNPGKGKENLSKREEKQGGVKREKKRGKVAIIVRGFRKKSELRKLRMVLEN